jgi:hypothetical protein
MSALPGMPDSPAVLRDQIQDRNSVSAQKSSGYRNRGMALGTGRWSAVVGWGGVWCLAGEVELAGCRIPVGPVVIGLCLRACGGVH